MGRGYSGLGVVLYLLFGMGIVPLLIEDERRCDMAGLMYRHYGVVPFFMMPFGKELIKSLNKIILLSNFIRRLIAIP